MIEQKLEKIWFLYPRWTSESDTKTRKNLIFVFLTRQMTWIQKLEKIWFLYSWNMELQRQMLDVHQTSQRSLSDGLPVTKSTQRTVAATKVLSKEMSKTALRIIFVLKVYRNSKYWRFCGGKSRTVEIWMNNKNCSQWWKFQSLYFQNGLFNCPETWYSFQVHQVQIFLSWEWIVNSYS